MMVGLVLAILVAVFAVQNSQAVTIQAYFWHLPQVSLVLVILLSALVGVALGALFGASRMWKMRYSHRQEMKQVKSERDAAVSAHQEAMKKAAAATPPESGSQQPPVSGQ
ncbi:MAG: LapA family protein [Sulfobacillus sp.]